MAALRSGRGIVVEEKVVVTRWCKRAATEPGKESVEKIVQSERDRRLARWSVEEVSK